MTMPYDESLEEHCDGHCVCASELVEIFYSDFSLLGKFEGVDRQEVPDIYRRLLDHSNHMTVTVESHHGESVDVEVLRSDFLEHHYRREILLRTHESQQVVQYGIVRLNTKYLAEKSRDEILEQRIPLGRVLIENGVLRNIELFDLLRIECGPSLARFFGVELGTITFGRTAMIHCDGEPAIELLEIVRP
jgi:hypothetical protein